MKTNGLMVAVLAAGLMLGGCAAAPKPSDDDVRASVTGSRIKTDPTLRRPGVVVIARDEIDQRGHFSLAEAIRDIHPSARIH
jgi:outer membrane receptor for ferrienterochelin and colicin